MGRLEGKVAMAQCVFKVCLLLGVCPCIQALASLWSAADRDRSSQQVQSTGAFKDSTHAPWEAVSQHRAQNLGSPSQPQRPWATCWDRDPQHPPP